jgi:hypothetical protein
MATIIICDRCGTPKGVKRADVFDFCHDCASCAIVEMRAGRSIESFRNAWQAPNRPVPREAAPAKPKSDPTKEEVPVSAAPAIDLGTVANKTKLAVANRRFELSVLHDATIYSIIPEEDAEAGQRIRYGEELELLELIEPEPVDSGKWYAMKVKK